jgi:hypothetical protein
VEVARVIQENEPANWRVDFRSGEVRPVEPSSHVAEDPASPDHSLDLPAIADMAALQRIESLPKEVGVMLMSVGVLGFVLPGVVGAPAVVAGGLALWPSAFRGVESWLRRRHPEVHRRSMRQIERYLNDLERRFPETKP